MQLQLFRMLTYWPLLFLLLTPPKTAAISYFYFYFYFCASVAHRHIVIVFVCLVLLVACFLSVIIFVVVVCCYSSVAIVPSSDALKWSSKFWSLCMNKKYLFMKAFSFACVHFAAHLRYAHLATSATSAVCVQLTSKQYSCVHLVGDTCESRALLLSSFFSSFPLNKQLLRLCLQIFIYICMGVLEGAPIVFKRKVLLREEKYSLMGKKNIYPTQGP